MCKKLFRLYNIEYINDMVIALPELIFRVLRIIAYVQMHLRPRIIMRGSS